jgi:hypothetical protein
MPRSVEICKVIYDPPGREPDNEEITLCNKGQVAVDVSGWQISDGEGFYLLPDRILAPGEEWPIRGSTYNTTGSTSGLYLKNSDDEVQLLDKEGREMDSYSW